MENPRPVNHMTPEESRDLGWAAEVRDADGHLCSQHGPFDDDASLAHYVREAMSSDRIVTIWPHDIAQPPSFPDPYT
jgi:hypothetical protein